MNNIIQNIDKELGHKWDKKRENFARHRLICYLLEDRSKKKQDSKAEHWLNDAFLIKDKQNTVIYGSNPCPMRQSQLNIRT